MTTTEPTRALADAAALLPAKPSLRALVARHREEIAGLDEEDRRAYEELRSERAREEARPELLAARAAQRWAMWCRSVPARYVDGRADPEVFARQPFEWWLSRLDAAQQPDRVAAWLRSPSATLVLVGPTGTGKTHAAITAGYAAAGQAVHTRFLSQLDYLAALRPGGSDDPGRVRWAALNTSLLVLDDLGAETEGGTEFVRREIAGLLDGRLNEGRRQVITLNADPDSLADTFGDRIMDRLRADAVTIHLAGDSRRRAARAPW